ncbi:MAG TPA: lysophospholipase [Candidatus Acidoferrum sp.]|nr:lysophospholipase [Candidatus Acidoferrum sp.]
MAESAVAGAGSIKSADGTKLAYRAWRTAAAQATFAVVHGLGEHSGRYARFAEGMARHGMSTYALDLRGHGESEGQRGHVDSWSQWTDDVSAFVSHVEHLVGAEVVPLGHSFGGAALLSTVLAAKLPNSKRFAVSSPALKLRLQAPAWKAAIAPYASKIVPRLAMDNEVDAAAVSRIPEVVAAYRNDPLVHSRISSRMYTEWQNATVDILGRAGQIKIPFLILAGTADPLIDPEGSRRLHELAPSLSELDMLEGRYHEPFNDLGSDEVFQLVADWMQRS